MCIGWVALLVGSRIDCCHTHTGLDNVTDAGLKDFSAVLGSSTTITTVELGGKQLRVVGNVVISGPCIGVHARVLGQKMGFSVVCLCGKVSRVCVLRDWRSLWGLVLIAGTPTQALQRSRTLA